MDFDETTLCTQRSWSLTEDDWTLDRMRVRCMTVKTEKKNSPTTLISTERRICLYRLCIFHDRGSFCEQGKGPDCRGYRVGAVLGHGERIAYLLHQWFSSHRGGRWEWMPSPRGNHGRQTFGEQLLLDFLQSGSADMRDRQTDRWKSCAFAREKKKRQEFDVVILNIRALVESDTHSYHGNSMCRLIE